VPVQIGVTMFSCHSSVKGIDQSGAPVFASIPSIEPSVMVAICRTPPIVNAAGEA
jgi:hypothetical protein